MTLMLTRVKQKLKSMRKMLEIVFVKEMNPLTRNNSERSRSNQAACEKKHFFSTALGEK